MGHLSIYNGLPSRHENYKCAATEIRSNHHLNRRSSVAYPGCAVTNTFDPFVISLQMLATSFS